MKIVLFYHSLLSDWNHGNAHFLRGVCTEFIERGFTVQVFEPRNGWSLTNLIAGHGSDPVLGFRKMYPKLESTLYDPDPLDLDATLDGADLVIVHEWNEPAFVNRIGGHHKRNASYILLFHDTHHRSLTDPESMSRYDLTGYDGVLAFGGAVRDIYLKKGWAERAWIWHEAADTRIFHPLKEAEPKGDLVWIGNWGDGERSGEIHEFLLSPVRRLGLRAKVYGVRYPAEALSALGESGIEYGGWLPNYRVPEVFSSYLLTVHIPRRPYMRALPGIPTIRVFEALACGIPLVSAPWEDREGLFTPGKDFLVAADGKEMESSIDRLLKDSGERGKLSDHGVKTIRSRHTCAHRVDELLEIYRSFLPSDGKVSRAASEIQ